MDNDLAQDVKLSFEDGLAETGSVSKAVRMVKQRYQEALDDPDEYPDLLLALAWLVSAHGKTDKELFAEAMRVIKEGSSLKRWQDSPEYEERAAKEQEVTKLNPR